MDGAEWIGYLVGVAINLAVGFWIYGDANKRGKSGLIWGLFGVLFSLITLVIWLIVRPKGSTSS